MSLALLALFATGCPPPRQATLGDDARVSMQLDPLRIAIADAGGRQVLELQGLLSALDLYYLEPQLLPGWEGYREGVREWLPMAPASFAELEHDRAVIAFAGEGATGRLTITTAGDRVRLSFALDPPMAGAPQKTSLVFALDDGESFFGLGERFASLDHRGQTLYSWAEEGGLGGGEDPEAARGSPFPNGPSMTYFPVPFLLSSAGYGMHLDTTVRTELALGSESEHYWRAAVTSGSFDVVVYAAAPLDALDRYTEDSGRPMIPAPWVWGPRRRIGLGSTVDGIPEWRALRERGVPTTGIDDAVHFLPHLSHAGREAELSAWTTTLHEAGFKVMAYNNPYVSASLEPARADFEYGAANGFFLLDDTGAIAETFFISGEPQSLATIDLTNPDAVAWFQSLLQRTLDLGYDGWMHDFGEYTERPWTAWDGSSGEQLHNRFPVLSARAAHELLERERPNDYLFFVRSGYAGSQRYVPAVWGGDAEATFDETQGIPSALRSGLSLGMSGVPYWGSDGTGFKCLTNFPRDKEVYLRWAELMAVSPIFMEQNACANPIEGRQEKWTLWSDDETTRVYGDMARLHTRLQPYFEVLARVAHERGTPIMRHAFLLHPESADARRTDEAFYLGPALWAAPVVRRGQNVKRTWLPPGRFVDLDDGTVFDGARQVEIAAPLAKLPLLLVAGELLPLLDESIETLAETDAPDVVTPAKVADRLDVWVALERAGSGTLVLADGTELRAEPTDEAAGASTQEPFGDVERYQIESELAARTRVVVDGTALSAAGDAARRVRWTLFRLP